MINLREQLNNNYKDLLNVHLSKKELVNYDHSNSVTHLDSKMDVQRLNPSNMKITAEKTTACLDSTIIRVWLGYSFLNSISNKTLKNDMIMSNLIFSIRKEMSKYYNDDEEIEVLSFNRPGENDNYFRDLEDHAGMELRLCLRKKKY